MKKLFIVALALFLYACGDDSSSSPEKASIGIRDDAIMDIVDSTYESGDLSSVTVYDPDSEDTLYFEVAKFDEDKNRYFLVDEMTGDTVVAKVGKGIVKVVEIRPNTEKSSDDEDDDDEDDDDDSDTSSKSGMSSSSNSYGESIFRSSQSAVPPEFSIVVENEEMHFDLSKMKMVDKRDGHEYGLRLDGTTLYMANNLNYEVEDSWCYNDYEKNCERYGRLYTWNSAYKEYGFSCAPENVQGICPIGWKINDDIISWLNGGYRDREGYYVDILLHGRSWTTQGTSYHWGKNKSCDYNEALVNDLYYLCSGSNCPGRTSETVEISKKQAVSVSCVYQWPVEVPKGVELPKPVDPPEYKRPSDLPAYSGSFGEIVDERDGNIYKTVKIGTQNWMAENLRYAIDSSFCKGGNKADSCKKNEHYGRMYKYSDANGFEEYDNNELSAVYPIQGVCPNGWHIPNMEEWRTLFNYALDATDGVFLAKPLMATEWKEGEEGGFDAFGFGVKESGSLYTYDYRYNYGTRMAYFMISDERKSKRWLVRLWSPEYGYDGAFYYNSDNYDYYPHIRCIEGKGNNAMLPPKPEESSDSKTPVESSDSTPPVESSDSTAPVESSDSESPVDPVESSDSTPLVESSDSTAPVESSDSEPTVDAGEPSEPETSADSKSTEE